MTTMADDYDPAPGTRWSRDDYDPAPGTRWSRDDYDPAPGTRWSRDDYDPAPGTRWSRDDQDAADQRVREACAGERSAVVAYLLRAAKGHTKHAAALRADAGTQADVESRGYERIASVLTDTARAIDEGRHWR